MAPVKLRTRRTGRPEERSEEEVPCAARCRLETGTRITAVTDAGQAVGGRVVRVWQTFADAKAGAFRVLVGPAGDDSSEKEAAS
jgi:hypothetical protein